MTYRELGFASYADYIAGPHWQDFVARYRKSKLPQACRVCGTGRVQLHHTTYERLGHELQTDVIPLCGEHHQAVHEWLTANGKPVQETGEVVRFLKALNVTNTQENRKHKRKRTAAEKNARPTYHKCVVCGRPCKKDAAKCRPCQFPMKPKGFIPTKPKLVGGSHPSVIDRAVWDIRKQVLRGRHVS